MSVDAISPDLERLVSERLQAELQAMRIKFSLCFAAILFALAAASLFWGGLKSKRGKDKEKRGRRRASSAAEVEEASASQMRAAKHMLRHRVSTSVCCVCVHSSGECCLQRRNFLLPPCMWFRTIRLNNSVKENIRYTANMMSCLREYLMSCLWEYY